MRSGLCSKTDQGQDGIYETEEEGQGSPHHTQQVGEFLINSYFLPLNKGDKGSFGGGGGMIFS